MYKIKAMKMHKCTAMCRRVMKIKTKVVMRCTKNELQKQQMYTLYTGQVTV